LRATRLAFIKLPFAQLAEKSMRRSAALLLCLLLPAAAVSQRGPLLERVAEVKFGEATGEIITVHGLVRGESRIVLASWKSVNVLDIATGKLVASQTIDAPDISEDQLRLISPDGRRILIYGNYGSGRQKDIVKRPPSVWDIETGRQIAVLDKTSKPIRAAIWSENGKILATSSDPHAPHFTDTTSVEVAFWDGETFEYKNSLPSDRAGWWALTKDGRRCIFSLGSIKTLLWLFDKYISTTGPVSIWDIEAGRIAGTMALPGGNQQNRVRQIELSRDGRFLALVAQPPKSKDSARRLYVWDLGEVAPSGSESGPTYEIKPSPKISDYGVKFSPGGKYLSVDAGKNLQIYEIRTGAKRYELVNVDNPYAWLTDEIFYDKYSTRMEVFAAATGQLLYKQRLIYSETSHLPASSYDPNEISFSIPVIEVLDDTKIIPHPKRPMFLTYSKQYVEVFDTQTGKLLQQLVSPPMDYTGKKPRLSSKPLVDKAGWSDDGRALYIIGADKRSVSLWRLS
jgi:WD40 repeat protein